jgi:hypothetical protein
VGPAVFGVVASLLAVAVWWWRRVSLRPRRDRRRPGGPEPDVDLDVDVDPADAADLDRRFARADDASRTRDDVVASRLEVVRRRVVPVRLVEPVPGLGASRVRFADGTTVIGHGVAAGDMGVLVAAVRHHAVHVESCRRQPDGMHVQLAWPGAPGGLGVVVTGLDQPD